MLSVGDMLGGRYRLKRLIGDGGMSNVYLADDVILNREVAVKILRHELAQDERFVKRFEREAQAITALVHKNIVEVYDVGSEDELHYIVMEFVQGKTLKQYIREAGVISVSQAVEFMKQIVSGVACAHSYGIIHRDLKPQNILIRADGVVKIMDFGIAYQQDATALTQTNAVMGSVHYLSPEQARGDTATVQSDIYALGIVFYEMLTGEVPFVGDSAVNIVLQHLRDKVPHVGDYNPHVPQSVENVIIRATAKNPENRYKTAKQMLIDIDSCLSPERMNEPLLVFDDDAVSEDTMSQTIEHTLMTTSELPVNGENQLSDEEQKKKDKKKKMIIGGVIGGAIVVIAAIVLAFVFMNQGAGTVPVPNVANNTIEEATTILVGQGFKVNPTNKEEYSDTVPAGTVIATDPKVGTEVAKGSQITLIVSKGKQASMPNLDGKSVDEAKQQLIDLGYSESKITINYKTDDKDKDTVIGQNPAQGTAIDPTKGTVTLTVSSGPETVAVPDMSTWNINQVNQWASENGIYVNESDEYSSSVEKGYVIRQNDYPGKEVKKGDTISVVISKGAEPVEPTTGNN